MAQKKKTSSSSPNVKKNKAGFTSADFETPEIPDYVIVELRYESPVAYAASKFSAPGAAEPQAASLNKTLEKYDIAAVRSHFGLKSGVVKSRVEIAATLPPEPAPEKFADKGMDLNFIRSGFVQIVPKNSADAKKIAKEFNAKNSVWKAFVAPRPVPAGATGHAAGSRNFEPSQGYLYSAPDGVGAPEIWHLEGAKGKGVTICDVEGNWNRKHEDLPSGIKHLGGELLNYVEWRNHGTAVLGEMISQPNTFGTVGISHEANGAVQSVIYDGVFNIARAIANATEHLSAGDVLLLELQEIGPNGKYVAVQYWGDVFSAIKAATEKGITVVEAAGNGDENFDLEIYNGTGLQKDSGAIIVGAGVPPTNHVDFDGFGGMFPPYTPLGVPRSRLYFSNYGKIVNVQGWGWHVTTLGYGDAQGGAENTWYTLRFAGTSSASPIVAGAAACLQGRAKAKNGAPLTPEKVRQILMNTGTPQEAGPGVPLTQNIGPQPNLPAAITEV